MKKAILTIILLISALMSATAFAYDVQLDEVVLDYDKGVIEVSGDIGSSNSGSRVAVRIIGSDGETVYRDQITSTAYGKFALDIKMTGSYKSGTYTLYVRGTDTEATAQKSFEFDASRDNYYMVSAGILSGEKLAEKALIGDELAADFEFYSSFGYNVGEVEYIWQAAGSPDGTFYDIEGTGEKSFVFTTEMAQKLYNANKADFSEKKLYLRLKVRAKTEASENFSEYAVSSNTVEIVSVPYAENVGIEKKSKTYKGEYDYGDFQDKPEQNSAYEWLVSSSKNGEYKVVETGLVYTVRSADEGKYIKFRVTPKTSFDSIAGTPVESEPEYIRESSSTGGSSGGGGGGGVSAAKPVAIEATPEPEISDEEPSGFSDVPYGHWATDAISSLVSRGIVSGIGDGLFAPDKSVKRAEFAAMILNAVGGGKMAYDGRFADVATDAWYAEIVAACSDLGLMNGADGYFRPEDSITREEMAKVLISVCTNAGTEVQSAEPEFTDADAIGDWARADVGACVKLGLISGMPDGTFAPKDNVTRAQAAVVTDKLCGIINVAEGEE